MNPRPHFVEPGWITRYQVEHPWAVPVLTWTAGFGLTLAIWYVTFTHGRDSSAARFEDLTNRAIQTLDHRLKSHEQVLNGLRGLFASTKTVERDSFREYNRTQIGREHL